MSETTRPGRCKRIETNFGDDYVADPCYVAETERIKVLTGLVRLMLELDKPARDLLTPVSVMAVLHIREILGMDNEVG